MPMEIARIFAVIAVFLAGTLIFIAHLLRPELRASEIPLSIYFTHPTRAIMACAYAAVGIALLSTAIVLIMGMHPAAMFTATACCISAALLLPVVMTTQRDLMVARNERVRCLHRHAAAAAFLTIGLAMAVSTYGAVMESDARVAIPGFFGAFLVGILLTSKESAANGLRQKLSLAILGLWIVAVATSG